MPSRLLIRQVMLIHRHAAVVRVWTPAKVNLFLEVLGRRPDGYHDLATLMVPVGLYDTLEIREAPPVTSTCPATTLACPAGPTIWWLGRSPWCVSATASARAFRSA